MSLKAAVRYLKKKPVNFDECIAYARHKFEKYFSHDIQQLLHVYPLSSKTKEGTPFWTLPKRPPMQQEFDPKNKLHRDFVAALACLRATIFKVEIPNKLPRLEQFKQEIADKAAQIVEPKFVPNDDKAKSI